MFGKRKLKEQIIRLLYRVRELEEKLCPHEQHEWVAVSSRFTSITGTGLDIETIHKCRCKNCGKECEKMGWEL